LLKNDRKRFLLLLVIILVSLLVSFIPIKGLSIAGRRTLGIFVFAMFGWITEVVPLYVVSMIVVALSALVLPPVVEGLKYSYFYRALSSSTIVLFAGGFFLASGMQKYKVDSILTNLVLSRTGTKPGSVLFGMMFTTAFLSMWMSNTATTALMITVALPVIKYLSEDDPFRTGLILAIPFAANIGGIATPIGTPPNAIALQMLNAKGITISFGRWMSWGLPFSLVLLLFAWFLLLQFFKPDAERIKLEIERVKITGRHVLVIVTFIVTATLWLLSSVLKISSSLIAFIPPVVFLSTGILNREDFKSIGWDVLILIGGGICLGMAMQKSGLSSWFLQVLHLKGASMIVIVLVFGLLTYIAANFMSHTAATNLLVPIAIGAGGNIAPVVVYIALMASVAMVLPVSTPPNAIAYSSGLIKTKDMARVGVIIGVLGLILGLPILLLLQPGP